MERENWRNVEEIKKLGRERRAYPLFFYEHLTGSYQEDDSLKKEK